MSPSLRHLLHPLNLGALATMGAIGLSLRMAPPSHVAPAWTLLLGFVLLFVLHDVVAPRRPRWGHALLLAMPLLALDLIWLTPRVGTAQVLLVIWTAMIAMLWPPRLALAAVLLVDVVVYLILRDGGHRAPFVVTLLYAGFQVFAALTAHYARSAERSRDALALVNADLLATRALLADSARDRERLRVARELHDVAGHKLTALTLNLRALATEPALAAREDVALAQRLAQELLGDIRGVVQALRDTRGLDLATAMRALAAPLPRPRLQLDIADDVQVTDAVLAEALLRLVQEALTNTARHTSADRLHVRLHRVGARLHLRAEDDGHVQGPLREGNGLAGMRERLQELGGTLQVGANPRGALRIDASLPL